MLQHPQWFRLWSRSGQLELFVPYLKLAVATQMSLKTWEVVCVVPFIDSMEWIVCSSYTWSVGSFFIEASPVEEHWSWDCEQFPGTANFRSYWMLGRWPLLHATAPTVRRLTFKGSSCMPPPAVATALHPSFGVGLMTCENPDSTHTGEHSHLNRLPLPMRSRHQMPGYAQKPFAVV